ALTIIDVRDREAFNLLHIQGAISMPLISLVDAVSRNLEQERDIYVYGDSEAMTAAAANYLREAGYENVAELTDGLSAWKAAQYPIEGI
ncbi:rhodanese-like domain-containing protein, partial [filamentous cyanobacterium CCP4]